MVIEFFSSLVRTRARWDNIAVVDRRFNKLVLVDPNFSIFVYYFSLSLFIFI